MTVDLSIKKSVINHLMRELRDVNFHDNKAIFRQRTYQIGQIIAYEISKELEYNTIQVDTPLAKANVNEIKHFPIILSVLRAGITLHNGVLSVLDKSESGFIASSRRRSKANTVEVDFEYSAHPDLEGKDIILCDPMLATGSCVGQVISYINETYSIGQLYMASIIASSTGIQYLESLVPSIKIWTCSVDEKLDENNYILPGLGDAGDLAYGKKEA